MPKNLIIYGKGKGFSKPKIPVQPVIGEPTTQEEEEEAEARFYEDRPGLSEVDTATRPQAQTGAAEETQVEAAAIPIGNTSQPLSLAELRHWKTMLVDEIKENNDALQRMASLRVRGSSAAKRVQQINNSIKKRRQLINQIDDIINHRTPNFNS